MNVFCYYIKTNCYIFLYRLLYLHIAQIIRHIKKNEKGNNININIKINYKVASFYKLFYDCKCIKSIYFKTFLRNNINNMSKMFANCTSIK